VSVRPAVGGRRTEVTFALALAAVALGVLALALSAPAAASVPGKHLALVVSASVAAVAVGGGLLALTLRGERREREKEEFFARSLARLQGAHGFARALGAALGDARQFFRARGVAVPVREWGQEQVYLWGAPAGAPDGTPAHAVELSATAGEDWLFEAGSDAWMGEHEAGRWKVLALDQAGRAGPEPPGFPGEAALRLATRLGSRRLIVVAFGRDRDWEGRLVLADPAPVGAREDALRFARRLVRESGAVVQSRFLLGRLRSRLGAMERARIARELHDGTIQSLVAVEMEMNVLRRRAEQKGWEVAGELARVQGLLRGEVLELRETMQRLKPIEMEPRHLVGFLDDMVARFGRDTGIRALFDCSVVDVDLAPRVCQEVARIVQEALHNVRKHSGARNVLVRFGRAVAGWRLVVDDDGRGFPFDGSLSHAELEEGRKGPFVIKERVRALGGELTIVTSPGAGARLEITLPREEP
jgi:signal transduction histidine kinase